MGIDFDELESALTKRCMQYGWGAKYYFPCSPKEISTSPLNEYYDRIRVGDIFAYHDDAPRLVIIEFVKIKNNQSIIIKCEREGDCCERDHFFPWLICELSFENGFFIHYKVDEFFEKDEADHLFCRKQGSMQSAR